MHAIGRYQSIEVVVEIEKSTTLHTDTRKKHFIIVLNCIELNFPPVKRSFWRFLEWQPCLYGWVTVFQAIVLVSIVPLIQFTSPA